MVKTIYVYLNDYDLLKIKELMSNLGARYYDKEEKIVATLPSLTDNLSHYKICFGETVCIDYSPCLNSNGYLQPGFFRSINANDSAELTKYTLITKYIKDNFQYSKINMCYYGQGFYDNWRNYEPGLNLPMLLESEQIEIKANEIDLLFKEIRELGFIIKPNDVRLRNTDIVDLSFDSFVIYSKIGDVIKKTLRKTFVHYDFDSKCIFVYKNEKKGSFSFVIDARIKAQNTTELVDLFEMLASRGEARGQ